MKDINLDLVYDDSICVKKTEWIQREFFENEIQKYSKKYNNNLFEKVLIAHFSSEGEVIDNNSLVMLSFKDGKTKVIHQGRKSNDSIFIDKYSFNSFVSKFEKTSYASFPNQITFIEFKKNNIECYFSDSYSGAVFESLKNLNFFN
ncbi:hypothetical protein WNY78_05585 [Psychroserpens sp. AS72]|uniref:hypothetical protein n=1 Tax=Psychroserpens sp. AS72 TaxID=3135775 RepID=UPI00317D736C